MRKLLFVIAGLALTLFYTSCGEGSGSALLSGIIQLGTVDGATVTGYKVNEDGSRGDELFEVESKDDGTYAVTTTDVADPDYTDAVEIVANGGTYTSEADSTNKTLDTEVSTLLEGFDETTLGNYETAFGGVPITPVTAAVVERAKAAKQPGFSFADALEAAKVEMKEALGGIDPYTMPYDPNESVASTTDDRAKMMQFMAGMAEAAATAGVSPHEYGAKFASDFKDGDVDGKAGTETVTFSSGSAFPTDALTKINTGIAAWDQLPPGTSSGSFTATFSFAAAPTNKFDDISGYYPERDEFDTDSYSKYLDPYNSDYKPLFDSHNGAAYDASKDPCNTAATAVYDAAKCPTSGSFSEATFISYAATNAASMGTYDKETGVYTSPSGTTYTATDGGAFVTSTGSYVAPPNTSTTGEAYTGTYTPGTTCASGTYWDPDSKTCKTPTTSTSTTCATGEYYNYSEGKCKTFGGTTASMLKRTARKVHFASVSVAEFFSKLFKKNK